jgi:hypothetical protein
MTIRRENCNHIYVLLMIFKIRRGLVLGTSCDILLEVDGVEHSRGIMGVFL